MIDQLGGRKAVAVVLCTLLGVGAVVLKGDVPANFMSLLEFLFGAFIAGNGVEHVAGAIRAHAPGEVGEDEVQSAPEMPPSADLIHLQESVAATVNRFDSLEEHLAATQQGVAAVQQTLTFIIQKTGLSNK